MAHEFKDDTLDDIKARDIFNLETFLKKKGREDRVFERAGKAQEWMGHRLNEILEHLGISLDRAYRDPAYKVDERMQNRGIVVENRMYDEPNDEWRAGLYVYKDHEIAGFVGYPRFDEKKFDGYHILCTTKI